MAPSPSKELLETLVLARTRYGESRDLVAKAYELAIRDKFSPQEARVFLMAELPFLSERTIRAALPAEAKDQNKVRNVAARLPQNTEKKSPMVVNITTSHQIIDKDPDEDKTEDEWNEEYEESKATPDPKDDRIRYLENENEELKQVIKHTEQFKPASQQVGFTKDTSEFSSVTFRMGVKDFTRAKEFISKEMSEYISKEFSAMKNRGWAVVEVVIRVV